VTPLAPGLAIAIVDGCCFQFRNTGADPLMLLISTMPRWPGAEEAVTVDGRW
jgi:mannose-6-phosphate isomerase-like protein (cupin superfamily)